VNPTGTALIIKAERKKKSRKSSRRILFKGERGVNKGFVIFATADEIV